MNALFRLLLTTDRKKKTVTVANPDCELRAPLLVQSRFQFWFSFRIKSIVGSLHCWYTIMTANKLLNFIVSHYLFLYIACAWTWFILIRLIQYSIFKLNWMWFTNQLKEIMNVKRKKKKKKKQRKFIKFHPHKWFYLLLSIKWLLLLLLLLVLFIDYIFVFSTPSSSSSANPIKYITYTDITFI